jgi:hypothetical protein
MGEGPWSKERRRTHPRLLHFVVEAQRREEMGDRMKGIEAGNSDRMNRIYRIT